MGTSPGKDPANVFDKTRGAATKFTRPENDEAVEPTLVRLVGNEL